MLKTNAIRIIEKEHIVYRAYLYDPQERIDALSVAEILHKPTEQVFKTLVTQADDSQHGFKYFVFVIPSNHELDVKKAAHAAGVKNVEMIPQKKARII